MLGQKSPLRWLIANHGSNFAVCPRPGDGGHGRVNNITAERTRMPRLYSYVVDHDLGFAPNPFGGCCTLAKCKYGSKRRNIVEMAETGDWIAGTGGADLSKSAGHGK